MYEGREEGGEGRREEYSSLEGRGGEGRSNVGEVGEEKGRKEEKT